MAGFELQSDLEEFRQRWLVSLKQTMPSQDCSLASVCSNSDSSSHAEQLQDDLDMLKSSDRWGDVSQYCSKTESRSEQQDSIEKIRGEELASFECSMSVPRCHQPTSRPTCTTNIGAGSSRIRKVPTGRILTKRRRRGSTEEDLVGQLIADINETTDVPFFDVKLPKEVGITVFSFLDYKDLCHCSQVSWSWHALANDEVLWFRVCQRHGFEKEQINSIAERSTWKRVACHYFVKAQKMRQNWRERRCQTQELQYPRWRVLCHANSDGSQVIAGYDTGGVCLWNVTMALDHGIVLSPGSTTANDQNRVTCTTVSNCTAAASFANGAIFIWNSTTGERQHMFSVQPGYHSCIRCICLSSDGSCLAVATDDAFQSHQLCHVYLSDQAGEEWLWLCKDAFQTIPHISTGSDQRTKKVMFVPGCLDPYRVILTTDRDAKLHTVGCSPDKMTVFEGGEARQIRLTCSDTTADFLACGVSGYGFDTLSEGYKVRVHSLHTGQFLYSLSGHWSDILCVDIERAPENMLVSGSSDKSVRVFDLRICSSVVELRGHISYVSHVQMDDWKVVSGTNDGTVYVWDQRMQRALWETHSRHPVQLCCFHDTRLITANVPPIQPYVYHDSDEDGFHRRYSGSIHAFDFAVVSELDTQDLPSICYSTYDQPTASSYRVDLAVPYDQIS